MGLGLVLLIGFGLALLTGLGLAMVRSWLVWVGLALLSGLELGVGGSMLGVGLLRLGLALLSFFELGLVLATPLRIVVNGGATVVGLGLVLGVGGGRLLGLPNSGL